MDWERNSSAGTLIMAARAVISIELFCTSGMYHSRKAGSTYDAFLKGHAGIDDALIHKLRDNLRQVRGRGGIYRAMYHLFISSRVVDVRKCGFEARCFFDICSPGVRTFW